MAATVPAATTRYFMPGTTVIYFVKGGIADPGLTPTRAELEEATTLVYQDEIASVDGWLKTSQTVDASDVGSRFTKTVNGRIAVDSSSITFHADKDGADVRDDLAIDDDLFVVFCDGGDVAGAKAEVFPARVLSIGTGRGEQTNTRLTVSFSITDEPEYIELPALTTP